jgi:hypothetical protein
MKGHADRVNGASVLADGRILSWSNDGTLRLWDGRSGAPLATMEGHEREVTGASRLPDGRILSWDVLGFLHLWDGQTGVSLSSHPIPWIEANLDFPLPDSLPSSFGKSHRFGNVWALKLDEGSIVFGDAGTEWEAFWHGTAPVLHDHVASSWVVSSYRHLHVLTLMRGNEPLEIPGVDRKTCEATVTVAPAQKPAQSTPSIPAPEAYQANPSVANDPVVLAKRKDTAVENFLNKARSSVKDGSIFFAPNIPEKKMKNALESYAPDITPDDVLVLIDITTFGGAKDGLILTKDKIYLKELYQDPQHFALADVTSCSFKPAKLLSELWINNQKVLEPAGVDKDAVATFATLLNSLCGELRSCEATVAVAPAENIVQSTPSIPVPEAFQANPSVANDSVTLVKRQEAAIENFLNKARSSVKDGSIFFTPNIPEKKVKNALGSYAPGVSSDDVLLLIDITTFGSAKEGLILTKDTIYLKEIYQDPQSFSLTDVSSFSFKPAKVVSDVFINDQKVFGLGGIDKDAMTTLATLLNSLCDELRSIG